MNLKKSQIPDSWMLKEFFDAEFITCYNFLALLAQSAEVRP